MVRELPHQVKDNVIILDVAPPKDVVDRICVLAHDDILSGHSGMARTVARAESAIWWPGMASYAHVLRAALLARNFVRCHQGQNLWLPRDLLPLLSLSSWTLLVHSVIALQRETAFRWIGWRHFLRCLHQPGDDNTASGMRLISSSSGM